MGSNLLSTYRSHNQIYQVLVGVQQMLETPPSSGLQAVLGNIKTVAETLGLIIGGLWAYYKFFKGRTFRPRLELGVAGNAWHADYLTPVIASVQIKNVGLSKLELTQEGSGLRVLSHALAKPEKAPAVVEWEWQSTVPVFEKHKWIEPGETISDQALFALGRLDHAAIRLELRIVSHEIEWNSLTIIKPDAKAAKAE